jgi:serine/threonine protein kinase
LRPQSALYGLTTFHEGRSLAETVGSDYHFTIPEIVRIAIDLARAIGALHRRSVIHRDIKPDNVHIGEDGQLRLLDLGTAISGFDIAGLSQARRAGTPTFLAPELFGHGQANPRTDLYSWAVTLYWILTRHYPYGEIEPFQTPRFTAPIPPSRYRAEIPGWFENILLRTLAIDPQQRPETAEELLIALEQGPASNAPPPKRTPLATRNTLLTWKIVSVALLLSNLVLLYLLIAKR